jgi:hypothetical protein
MAFEPGVKARAAIAIARAQRLAVDRHASTATADGGCSAPRSSARRLVQGLRQTAPARRLPSVLLLLTGVLGSGDPQYHSDARIGLLGCTRRGQSGKGSRRAEELPNKRMQLTKLRAAPVWQAEVPPCAPAGGTHGGTASQLIRSVGQTEQGSMPRTRTPVHTVRTR